MQSALTSYRDCKQGGFPPSTQTWSDKTKGPRPIIAKFEHYQQKELIKSRGRELKGTKFGLNYQFQREINERRKRQYPVQRQRRVSMPLSLWTNSYRWTAIPRQLHNTMAVLNSTGTSGYERKEGMGTVKISEHYEVDMNTRTQLHACLHIHT